MIRDQVILMERPQFSFTATGLATVLLIMLSWHHHVNLVSTCLGSVKANCSVAV